MVLLILNSISPKNWGKLVVCRNLIYFNVNNIALTVSCCRLTDDYQRTILLEAEVTEAVTGRKQNATKEIVIHKYPYKMDIIRGSESFKPGLPYSITIKVSSQDDIPINDNSIDALKVKHGFTYSHEEYETSYYKIPPTGLVTLTFQAPNNDSLNVLGIEATYKELTEWFPTVQRALSPSNTYLDASLLTKNPKVSRRCLANSAQN